MAESYDFGRRAEQLALNFLLAKGYRVLHTNWRYYRKEIDIVCTNGSELVIVEVKARNNSFHSIPGELISRTKQRHLEAAAEAYIFRYSIELPARFDLVAIVGSKTGYTVEHYENAWYPQVN